MSWPSMLSRSDLHPPGGAQLTDLVMNQTKILWLQILLVCANALEADKELAAMQAAHDTLVRLQQEAA